jgi:two-component system cell cycle sensor histidine kinase/response regulator CckA
LPEIASAGIIGRAMEASPRSRFLSGRRLALAAVAAAGAALAIWSFQDARTRDRERTEAEFVRRTAIRHALTREVLVRYEDSLFGLSTLFMVEQDVSRTQFRRAALRLAERIPGTLALQWVPQVAGADRAKVEAALRQSYRRPELEFTELGPDGRPRRAGDRDSYLPIAYIEPLPNSETVLGLDLQVGKTSESLRLARDTNRITLTPQVRLVQTPDRGYGVIMIAPVRRLTNPNDPPETATFEGHVQAVFLAHDLLERTSSTQPDTLLDTLFVDASETDPAKRVLYYRPADARTKGQPAPTLEEFRHGMVQELPLPIGGRDWRVLYRPRAGWIEEQFTPLPWVRTGGVLLVTVLLAGLVQTFGRRTELVEREVAVRTAELETARRLLEDDIRQRTTAEQALKASEVRLQAIVDHSPNSIFVKDLAGRYVLVSRQHARMWNRPAGDFIGRDDAELFPPDIAARFRESDQQMLSAEGTIKYELTVTLPGATTPTTAIVQKFPLLDAEGRIYGMCGISTDITDRKQAEQEKLAIERKLLAAQKLESLGVLAGGIAHDFNNILTSVLANASLARHDAAAGRSVDRSLQQIELAARRAADLCQQMLAYAGKGKIVSDRLDLSELVRGTAALLEVTLSKNTKLDLRLAAGLPPVLADPTQLRQIVMNLVINAADAITGRAGLITVTTFIRAADTALLRSALGNPDLPPGSYVGLEVTDNGSGMTPETITRIFEPFFTTKFSGRGLGLSAVLGIVQSHRGALFVESTPGQGSTFRLLLPATSGQTVSSAPPFPAAGPVALRGTVLLVDDEEAVRSIAATVLEIHGAGALTAASGDEALALLRTHGEKISLVLLDLTMPGINGEETLRRMRMLGARQPVILMSGYSEIETMQHSANLGVAGFIQKPFEVETLLAKTKPFLS